MQQYDDLDAIHIVSHGDVGELSLGSTKLNQNALNTYADNLVTWRDSIANNGDILLYGCSVAEGAVGEEFIEDLSQYTAADILASVDLTGSEDLGGDWDLEFATGDIEEDLAFNAEIKSSDRHIILNSDSLYAPYSGIDISNFTDGDFYLDSNINFDTNFDLNFDLAPNIYLPNSSQLNNPLNINLETYSFKNPRYNRELFNFEPSQINFNANDFDYNSVDINNNSISFEFRSGTEFAPSSDATKSLEFSFDDYTFDFDSRFSFNADSVTFENNKVKFEFDADSLDFRGADLFSADNVHLFEYKLLNNEITLPDGELTFADFNASDFRALDYAYPGDELFDGEYYFATNVIPADMNPFTDYIENGYQAGRNPNGLFNVNYYLENNIDVKNNGMDPLKHFALFGYTENFDSRDPNRFFDSSYYNAKNPKVVEAGMNPLLHYMQFGWKESRIDNPGGFNPNRDPSPFLDTSYYFDKNIDVLQASYLLDSANPNQHVLEFVGIDGLYANEDRITHPLFESEKTVRISKEYTPDSDPEEISNIQKDFEKAGLNLTKEGKSFKISQSISEDDDGFLLERLFFTVVGGAIVGTYRLGQEARVLFDRLVTGDGNPVYDIEIDQNTEISGYSIIPDRTLPSNTFSINYGDPSLEDLLRIRPFPGQTENQIVAEIFTTPEIDGVEDFTIFPEDSGIFLPTTTEFPQRDETLEAILNGGLFLGGEEDPLGAYFLAAGREGNIIGGLREQAVAEITGGTLAKDSNGQDIKLFEPGVSEAVAIDVFGPNGELILVGGPNKAANRSVLGQRVKDLKIVAEARGVKAQYYFSDNTPQSAIEFVKKEQRLGAENVFTFPEVTLP